MTVLVDSDVFIEVSRGRNINRRGRGGERSEPVDPEQEALPMKEVAFLD